MEDKNKKNEALWWQPGLMLFYKLSGWIAGPIILALFVGKWLDKKYQTEPWFFLISVGVAFIISSVGITKDAVREMKRIEREDKKMAQDKIVKK